MNRTTLTNTIRHKNSFLCTGLDPDMSKIPSHLLNDPDPIFAFNKKIIDATKDYSVAYKLNSAFYEVLGSQGWKSFEKTVNYIPEKHFKIADVKRADIGNTARKYASAFFEKLPFDAVTLSPYMGHDSVTPFLEYPGKWAILLGLTSNAGASDLQLLPCGDNLFFEKVMQTSKNWGNSENLMYVTGATQDNHLERIRKIIPDHFLLVPGVGAQGGNLENISAKLMNQDCGILVNVGRDIIYAGNDENFEESVTQKARIYQEKMKHLLAK